MVRNIGHTLNVTVSASRRHSCTLVELLRQKLIGQVERGCTGARAVACTTVDDFPAVQLISDEDTRVFVLFHGGQLIHGVDLGKRVPAGSVVPLRLSPCRDNIVPGWDGCLV